MLLSLSLALRSLSPGIKVVLKVVRQVALLEGLAYDNVGELAGALALQVRVRKVLVRVLEADRARGDGDAPVVLHVGVANAVGEVQQGLEELTVADFHEHGLFAGGFAVLEGELFAGLSAKERGHVVGKKRSPASEVRCSEGNEVRWLEDLEHVVCVEGAGRVAAVEAANVVPDEGDLFQVRVVLGGRGGKRGG